MAPQLSRLMIFFGVIGAAFIIVSSVLQPDSFGWYGHYRGKALSEIASNPVKYVDSEACAECHDEQTAEHAAGPHKHVSCQACHGPGNRHIEDPTTDNITRPVPATFCVRCHMKSSARPKDFPQIVPAEHTEGQSCEKCHNVHNPDEFKE